MLHETLYLHLQLEIVDLEWNSLTVHSEDGTLSWSKEVHTVRLQGAIWVEYLLGHIEQ